MSELVVNQENAVLTTLQTALNKGVDADSLEKLLNMQERVLDRQAEQAYTQAMVIVQADAKRIVKNKENKQTSSKYADLDAVISAIKPVYTANGFSISFGTADSPHAGHVRVTAKIRHSAGWSESEMIDIPLDDEGIAGKKNKTQVHGTSSAISYGRRYLLAMIFNINTGDDDDGNAAGGDTRSAMEVDSEWIERVAIWREILPSILAVKEGIALNDLDQAIEAWHELTKEEMSAVWNPAPTKGGILTTVERTVMKSNEWSQARNAMSLEGDSHA